MNYSRGSMWRKWDLHVHTPDSLVQNYSGDNDAAWDRYITELEALPPEFKVIGINDYIFIDGYKRVQREKEKGRLSNIDLFLPVIELRLNIFGGTSGALSRVNFHIIFSNSISPEIIQMQFLNALSNSYQLSPDFEYLKDSWQALPTKESITELGSLIIKSVPEEKKADYKSPLEEGFNNLNFDYRQVLDKLDNHYFKGKYFTALGKTEWASIKWNDQSIAEKKSLINKVDFVFISSETISNCNNAKKKLTEEKVNNRLLDCSDAHNYSDSKEKDRIGKCFTWIKSDTTFEGLRQTLYEPDRIFIGDYPDKYSIIEKNKTKYLNSLEIKKKVNSTIDEHWFNDSIELNPGLIAIIGNKGSGKSAFADIIGLLGDSKVPKENFSFLNLKQFCRPNEHKAENFTGKITWVSGESAEKYLHELVDENQVEAVRYIPQNYFEEICNEISENEDGNFDKELKKVIFSHVNLADRLGCNSLGEIIDYRTKETDDAVFRLRRELSIINDKIVEIENRLKPSTRAEITNQITKKQKELASYDESKPIEVEKPNSENPHFNKIEQSISEILENMDELSKKIDIENAKEEELAIKISNIYLIKEKITNFIREFDNFKRSSSEELKKLGLDFDEIFVINCDTSKIESLLESFETQKKEIVNNLNPQNPDSNTTKMKIMEEALTELRAQLDEPNRKYQLFMSQMNDWQIGREKIIGNKDSTDTLRYYEAELDELKNLPSQLSQLENQRKKLVKEIYSKLQKLCETYRNLYTPVQQFIDSHRIAKEKFALKFDVSLIQVGFMERFFDDFISHSISGSFCGVEEGEKKLDGLLQEYNLNTEEGTFQFVNILLDNLRKDTRIPNGGVVEIETQLKRNKSLAELYNFIFALDYLQPRYVLKMGEKELNQLSPGEKGALLLVFYLLVDKDDIPLIIDQPEHNLDNQTIYDLLVESVIEAKQRRQVIIVTHNPNLAVVCDAEQIICASLNKTDKNKVKYLSGAIENPKINKTIVDVLEGTRPAFDKRRFKYIQESK